MAFTLPDLVVESILRDGFEAIEADPTILDEVFSGLTEDYASRKFGSTEITDIKAVLTGASKKNVAIVNSFHEASAKMPCVSIQLGSDMENAGEAYLDDFEEDLQETVADPNTLIKVSGFTPDAYDSATGQVEVPDSVDLTFVYPAYIFVDASGDEFEILEGMSNASGDKFFFIAEGSSPDIGGACSIKTFVDYTQLEIRGSVHDVQILLGVHTEEAMLTKYLYTLVKYFLKSRKHDLINRGIIASTMSGSDFLRDESYAGDMVYTRFLTLSGKVEDSWRSDNVPVVDHVEIDGTAVE